MQNSPPDFGELRSLLHTEAPSARTWRELTISNKHTFAHLFGSVLWSALSGKPRVLMLDIFVSYCWQVLHEVAYPHASLGEAPLHIG